MAASTGLQGGHQPLCFVAESNLRELEEQKAPGWWLFLSRGHPWVLSGGQHLSCSSWLSRRWENTAGQARRPAVSGVSVAGAGAVPTAVPARWPCR